MTRSVHAFHAKISNIKNSRKFVYLTQDDLESLNITTNDIVIISHDNKRAIGQCVISKNESNGMAIVSKPIAYQLHITESDQIIHIKKSTLTKSHKSPINVEINININEIDDTERENIKNYIIEKFYHQPFILNEKHVINYHNTIMEIQLKGILQDEYIVIDKNIDINFIYKTMEQKHDVILAGLTEARKKIEKMVIRPLSHPEIFNKFNKVIPQSHGILLSGPTGVGKTLLMTYIKSQCDVNFIHLSAVDIFTKFYGESEKNVRELFKKARDNSPTIIFIDELDSIASKRSSMQGDMERRVFTQLLVEMDQTKSNDNIIVIGATNRIENIDVALRRPGRFDTEIVINSPNEEERKEIFNAYLNKLPLSDDVDVDTLAKISNGYVGADIYGVVRIAFRNAVHNSLEHVNLNHPIITDDIKNITITMHLLEEAIASTPPSVMRNSYFEVPDVTMEQIGGLEKAKDAVEEAVEWRIDPPKELIEIGGDSPSGILLYGPPGSGKSMLGKAVANKKGIRFFVINGPEILSEWLGGSEKAIREIFAKARMSQPCVIFIDEIDSIAPQRGQSKGDSHAIDRLVNQLLIEIDGINSIKNIVIMAATNRPDILDKALLRTGRFDYKIYVSNPDHDARMEIFKSHLTKINTITTKGKINYDTLATLTDNYSGSDIGAIIRIAITRAVREKRNYINMTDLEWSIKNKVSPSIEEESTKRYKAFQEQNIHNQGVWVNSDSSLYS